MMKKAAILTRTDTINFGTILQNYALQQAILRLGWDAETVDDALPRSVYSPGKPAETGRRSLKVYLYGRYDIWKTRRADKRTAAVGRACRAFTRRNIRYRRLTAVDELSGYDAVISGSDQIWAEAAEPHLFPFFMQDRVDGGKTVKASYAVSVGADYPGHCVPEVRRYLADLDRISVREPSSAAIISKYTDRDIAISCDPVLLHDTAFWERASAGRKEKRPYILCYFLTPRPWYYDAVRRASAALPGAAVKVCEKKPSGLNEYEVADVRSPRDFLSFIRYADYVLTDSFHVMLFSLIFGRSFSALRRFSGDDGNFQNERLRYIADRLGIPERYVTEAGQIDTSGLDYSSVRERIRSFRDESEAYLAGVLSLGEGRDTDG